MFDTAIERAQGWQWGGKTWRFVLCVYRHVSGHAFCVLQLLFTTFGLERIRKFDGALIKVFYWREKTRTRFAAAGNV